MPMVTGLDSPPGVSCYFRSESVRNRYSGVFEDAKHEYENAEGIRGTWAPGRPLLLEFLVNFVQKLSEIISMKSLSRGHY